jgi:hypothetical protein
MKMYSLQRALRLNNEAVHLFTEKRVVEAVRTFEATLMRMKQATLEATRWNLVVTLGSGGEQQDFLMLGPRIGLESDACFIFDRPMMVPSDPKIETSADLELFVHWSSTAIVFNYALACHQYSMMSGSDTVLRSAMRMYQLAIKMAANSKSDRVMYSVLECTALNNLAHALYTQCSFEENVRYARVVYDKVSMASDLDSHLSRDEIDGLLLNSLFLQAPVATKAA